MKISSLHSSEVPQLYLGGMKRTSHKRKSILKQMALVFEVVHNKS